MKKIRVEYFYLYSENILTFPYTRVLEHVHDIER